MENKLKFDIQLTNLEKINPLFSKAKAFIMYHGDNRNKSAISKQTVETALPTLFNCPVIGEYSETLEDFRGHGGKLEISSEGIKYIQTTRPYGIIPESSEVKWENVIEKDGKIHEYLTCDVILWTGRYPEVESVITNGKSQSMEIEEITGTAREDGYFNIESFVFSALCILGDDIEPCFEGASITAYTLDKDLFKQEFDLMVKELKETVSSQTNDSQNGGVGMENLENKENIPNEENNEENSATFAEEGQQENNNENLGNNENLENNNEDFSLTTEQMKDEIRRCLRTEKYVDDYGYEYRRYWYVDYQADTNTVIAEDEKARMLVSLSYSMNNDSVTIDFNSAVRVKVSYVPFEEGSVASEFEFISNERKDFEIEKSVKEKETTIFDLNTKLSEINDKYSTLETEYKEYKATVEAEKAESQKEAIKAEKEAIFNEYKIGLTDEEMKSVKDNQEELSADNIRTKLNEIFTKKNFAKLKEEQGETVNKDSITIDILKKERKNSRYAI